MPKTTIEQGTEQDTEVEALEDIEDLQAADKALSEIEHGEDEVISLQQALREIQEEAQDTKEVKLLTPTEAAEILGEDRSRVYRWIESGEIGAMQVMTSLRIPTSEVTRFKAKREAQDNALSVMDIAEDLRVTYFTARRLLMSGEIPFSRKGTKYLVAPEDYDAWKQSNLPTQILEQNA